MNGFILESRQILESDIWSKPPIYFKVWHYLLLNAEYRDTGNLKRGQLFTTIDEIAEACSYKVGYRKIKPTRKEIWGVLEFLRNPHERNNETDTKGTMIVTTKVTHGMIVTICNYNKYQDPKLYESNNERNNEKDTKGTTKRTVGEQYYKEYKEYKNNNINNNYYKEKEKERESEVVNNSESMDNLKANHEAFLQAIGSKK